MSDRLQSYQLEDLIAHGSKSPYFASLYSQLQAICWELGITEESKILDNLKRLWLPLALKLVQARNKSQQTLIQGILGSQGTGKSTLCKILKPIVNYLGFSLAVLSIDDLYLTYAERKTLQKQDPRLIWRGPPGTHDVELGLRIIEQCLQANTEISLPRFDKSAHNGMGDRTASEIVPPPDILLFEGWFVGVEPIATSFFDHPPTPIVTPDERQFALDCNQRLKAYLPLWDKLDGLVVLYPEDYRLAKQWRKDAEHKMIALGKTGMSDLEIDRFVEYFWQALHPELFITPLTQAQVLLSGDRQGIFAVVKINQERRLQKITGLVP